MHGEVLTAPEALTIRGIAAFADQIRARLEYAAEIKLDLAESKEFDLSALQLIVAARAQAATMGKSIMLARPASGALLSLLERAAFLTDLTPADVDFWFHGERPQ